MRIALVVFAAIGGALLVIVVRQHRLQRRAWKGWDTPDASGYSRFQVECERAVAELVDRRGVKFVDRHVDDLAGTHPERSIRATLGDTGWTLWIDENAAQLSAPQEAADRECGRDWTNLEAGAHKSPHELIASLLARVESVLDARLGRADGGRIHGAVQQADAADEAQGGTRTAS